MATLRDWPWFNRIRRRWIEIFLDRRRESLIEVCQAFPAFTPCSAGDYVSLARLTLSSINRVLPLLQEVAQTALERGMVVRRLEEFPATQEEKNDADRLRHAFDRWGSDKGSELHYHHLYAPIFRRFPENPVMLEIGIGTNHADTVSHMGKDTRPGGSLRAFRDFCPSLRIFGADLDPRILFQEDRIRTFFVDQTRAETFEELRRQLPGAMDLIIDDGLHSPEANLQTLRFALPLLRPGGWCVIEDITPAASPLWQTVGLLLGDGWRAHCFQAARAVVFAVQRAPREK